MSNNNSVVSSNWPGYSRLWKIVAIILLILLILLWLLGFGPGGSKCEVPPTIVEKKVEVEKLVDNPKLLTRITELEKENAKIAGLMTTIKGLETENTQIETLKAKISDLEGENTKISGLMSTVKGLKSENAKIAGLMSTIVGLKADNSKIDGLKTKIKTLEVDNAKIAGLMTTVKELKADNAKISADLTAKIKSLETENTMIPELKKTIEKLKNQEPKVIEKIKIVEKIVKVPSAPSAPVAPAAPVTAMAMSSLPAPAKLYFDVGSAEFPADVDLSLSGVIAYLKKNPSSTASISGFHDSTGSLEANKALSLKRAEAVMKLMVEAGVSIDNLQIDEPQQTTGSGSPEEARRVEVLIVK